MSDPKISVSKDGPYLVTGGVPLLKTTIVVDEKGRSVDWDEGAAIDVPSQDCALCRCGRSSRKPFCDGAHLDPPFDGTETAARTAYLDRALLLEGPVVQVTDDTTLCAEARYCAAGQKLWRIVDKTDDEDNAEQVIRQSSLCPGGRYTAWDAASGMPYELDLEPSIGIVEDPHAGVSGGLWVRGGIPIESADGHVYEIANRRTLCRCGGSGNKPFCDGTHCDNGFNDGL